MLRRGVAPFAMLAGTLAIGLVARSARRCRTASSAFGTRFNLQPLHRATASLRALILDTEARGGGAVAGTSIALKVTRAKPWYGGKMEKISETPQRDAESQKLSAFALTTLGKASIFRRTSSLIG